MRLDRPEVPSAAPCGIEEVVSSVTDSKAPAAAPGFGAGSVQTKAIML